ncbi:hypothetical protein LIG30_2122 [Burkholderia sp. lig30]|jgi:hypothetical protein|nr:hypothetical protein LIG30_2122 [Burkholderia sp. lig30]
MPAFFHFQSRNAGPAKHGAYRHLPPAEHDLHTLLPRLDTAHIGTHGDTLSRAGNIFRSRPQIALTYPLTHL